MKTQQTAFVLDLRDVLPPSVRKSGAWCIAGGYAACPALASDIDVWIYGVEPEDVETMVQAARAHLMQAGLRHEIQDDTRTQEGAGNYVGLTCEIRKVAIVTGAPQPIHLMVTTAYDPLELLSGFDISTHAVAILPNGTALRGDSWTPPHVDPRAVHETTKTPARMAKIRARFGRDPKTGERHSDKTIPF